MELKEVEQFFTDKWRGYILLKRYKRYKFYYYSTNIRGKVFWIVLGDDCVEFVKRESEGWREEEKKGRKGFRSRRAL